MFKHILIPTDGSDLSRKAVLYGVQLAKASGAKVTGAIRSARSTTSLIGPSSIRRTRSVAT